MAMVKPALEEPASAGAKASSVTVPMDGPPVVEQPESQIPTHARSDTPMKRRDVTDMVVSWCDVFESSLCFAGREGKSRLA